MSKMQTLGWIELSPKATFGLPSAIAKAETPVEKSSGGEKIRYWHELMLWTTSEFPAGKTTYSSPTNKMFGFATFVSPRTLRNEREDTADIYYKRTRATAIWHRAPIANRAPSTFVFAIQVHIYVV
jgi:hypothetical protein